MPAERHDRRGQAMERIKRFLKDEEGATAVEYGLIIAAIAAGIVSIVFTLGGQIKTAFQTVSDSISSQSK
jgi:pilus assembly protein Flp/PilA